MVKNGAEGSRLSLAYGFESHTCRCENVSRNLLTWRQEEFRGTNNKIMMCPVVMERRGSSYGMLLSRPPESEMAGVLAGSEL